MTAIMTKSEPSGRERELLAAKRGLSVETRRNYPAVDMSIRADEDDADSTKLHFSGHASVTGRSYPMYGGPSKGGWNETVDAGAFKKTLSEKPDVAFLVNHEGMTLARTKAGSLRLAEDKIGLAVDADLDRRVSAVSDLAVLMEGGEIDEMSFAFRIVKQQWFNTDGEEVPWWDLDGIDRHLAEVSIHKGDVSAVNYGASPFTDASARSLTETLRAFAPADVDPDELREAITHLQSLLPAAAVVERAGGIVVSDELLALWEHARPG